MSTTIVKTQEISLFVNIPDIERFKRTKNGIKAKTQSRKKCFFFRTKESVGEVKSRAKLTLKSRLGLDSPYYFCIYISRPELTILIAEFLLTG